MQDKKLISIVFSFRNEEDVIPELVDRIEKVFEELPYDNEMIFVNDTSTDRSLEILKELRENGHPNIRVLNMARRCGVPECAFAGMEQASGAAVILMDADLQDPPELIPKLVEEWKNGGDVVYTVRTARAGESKAKMFITKMAYQVIRLISEIDLPINSGDFKLISRPVLDELLNLKDEKEPYLRGMVTWTGFNQVPVYYERHSRAGGITHFPLFGSRGPIRTFLSGLTSFTTLPLNILLLIGALASLLVLLLFVIMLIASLVNPAIISSWAPFMLLAVFCALQLLGMGVLGIYMARIYRQVLGRPSYTVKNRIGFDSN